MKARSKRSFLSQWIRAQQVRIKAATFAALFLGILTVSVSAQLTTADVLGTITDSTGAVVPGATATIKNLGTGVTATTKSNETGDYIFNLLPPGRYSMVIQALGFKQVVYSDITLAAGDRARENGSMQTGGVEEVIQ